MEGCTALYAACRAGFVDTVRLLLENGMDPALQAVCGAP
jgi:ankyrin repeat protein